MSDYATSLLGNGFNNDWLIKNKKPLGDLKLAASLNQRWMLGGRTLGMLAALNYTNEYRTYENMENNLYGIYDAANDKPNYLACLESLACLSMACQPPSAYRCPFDKKGDLCRKTA